MLKAENIKKRYFQNRGEANYFEAVKELSLTLAPGTVSVLMGRSGSGKTTLLHMLSGLLAPTEGRVLLDGTDIYALPDKELSEKRSRFLAVVPQARSLLDTLTVMENILLPARLYGRVGSEEAARTFMQALGIGHLKDAFPRGLSGGELRRAAIARSLCQDTPILLCDEPTGDLDDENTAIVLDILLKAAKEQGKAVFLATHESEALKIADAAYKMDGGRIEDILIN